MVGLTEDVGHLKLTLSQLVGFGTFLFGCSYFILMEMAYFLV
jgi:hypothetical protein